MASSLFYDLYGRLRGGQTSNPVDAPMPYQIKSVTTTDASTGYKTVTRYTRFSGDNEHKVGLWREITVFDDQGTITDFTHEFSVDFWANVTDDTVRWVPINECWDFPIQKN